MISRNPRKQNKHEVNSYHNKMNAMALYILLLLSKAFLLASCENETSTPLGPSKKIEKKVQEIAQEKNIPSMAVQVYSQESPVDFDYHNKEVKSQQLYGIGSATKLLSAVLIFKRVEQQQLSLDDKIIDHVPDMAHIEGIENVTVKHLLNHTSGLADYTKNPKWIESVTAGNAPKTFEEKLALIGGGTAPTRTFSYSNSNFVVLEKVVEALSGMSFEEAFNDFYQGLGLPTITMGSNQAELQAFYAETSSASANVSHWEEHYGFDGGAYATPAELEKFLQMLFISQSILSTNSISQMQDWIPMQPSIPIGSSSISEYGLGIMKLEYEGKTYLGHFGGTLKYQSFVFFDDENKVGVSMVTNCSGRHYNNVFFQELVPAVLDEL